MSEKLDIVDKIIESFVDGLLPGFVCPILRDCAGDDCVNLKSAILMNESLLQAYQEGADDVGLWDYDTVKGYAQRFPRCKKMIDEEKVIQWLRKEGHEDIVYTVMSTPGGMVWLKKQIDDFKDNLFGDVGDA